MGQAIDKLRVRAPKPRVDRYDPFALRALLVLATGLVALVAGDAAYDRLTSSGEIGRSAAGPTARLDAWVSPPVYTGVPPIMLIDGSLVGEQAPDHEAKRITVPEGSKMVLRAIGGDHKSYALRKRPGDKPDAEAIEPKTPAAPESDMTEFELALEENSSVVLANEGTDTRTWSFQVTPDNPPTIDLKEDPQVSPRGALKLSYYGSDDYGVTGAEATFELVDPKADGEKPEGSEVLYGTAPRMGLRLKRPNVKKFEGTAFKDLTAHPWAGLKVAMTLQATDQAKQVGIFGPKTITLPARQFRKPMARAVVEQRQNLFLKPQETARVADALDALMIAPHRFIKDMTVYLGLRTVSERLRISLLPPAIDETKLAADVVEARAERRRAHFKRLRSVVDQLWQIALRIEDGDLSEAERALRAAQERLAEALRDGASDEEIQDRMRELREALNRFLEQLARQAQNANPSQMPPRDPNSRQMSQQDLARMLEQIERLARSGSRDAAQQMLSQLREMLEQLQAGRQQQGTGSQAMQMLEQFGDLIQQQQQLLDDTFRAQRGLGQQNRQNRQGRGQQRRQGQGQQGRQRGQNGERLNGQRGRGDREGDDDGLFSLGQRQGDLRRQLEQLLEDLKGLGAEQPGALGEAGEAMGQAEEALGEGQLGDAQERERQALDNLRKGAQELANQIIEQMQQARGGQGRGRTNSRSQADPLGRHANTPQLDADGRTKVPGEIDIQRARRILEELRRRLSDPNRRPAEIDYLERLLKRF